LNKSKRKQSHSHHYVLQWYQKRFLLPGQTNFYYLDLQPETIVWPRGSHQLRAVRHLGPSACFYRDDLYTIKFGKDTSDEMETFFFGAVDSLGRSAVSAFAGFEGVSKEAGDAFRNVAPYMGAQLFRTPRGLDFIKSRARSVDSGAVQNAALFTLQAVFQSYSTIWTEGVWEIVRATRSRTKFIVTDGPITFYCKVVFPSEWSYPNDMSPKQIGTRTIFPLGLESCLIITHLQLARNPWSTPTEIRANARHYDQAIKHLGDIQFGRELEEDDVLRINYVLKRRATRFIAAANEEWLYPERSVSTTDWPKLDDDWFLLPNLWSVSFTTGIRWGDNKGRAFARDEYGRRRGPKIRGSGPARKGAPDVRAGEARMGKKASG
jgi:hypothetical protein